jgi:hypothetical protein
MTINFLTYVKRNAKEVVETEWDGRVILLQGETFQIHHFNEAASEAWRLLDTPQSVSSLAIKLYNTVTPSPLLANALIAWVEQALDKQLLDHLPDSAEHLSTPYTDLSQQASITKSLDDMHDFQLPLFIESCDLSSSAIQGNSTFQTDNFQTGS